MNRNFDEYDMADLREHAAQNNWELPEDNPELHELVDNLTKGVTLDTYIDAMSATKSPIQPPAAPAMQSPVRPAAAAMVGNPSIKSSISPGSSASIDSKLVAAQMFLDMGMWDVAKNHFQQILDDDPGNTAALAGLDQAKTQEK